MSYTLTMRTETDYLHVEATGIRTRDTVLGVATDCIAACKEHGYRRLLVDVQRMTGRLLTMEVYDLAKKDFPRIRQNLGVRVVIIDLDDNRDRFQFLEDVAVNEGIDLRVFSNAKQALEWLLGPKTTDSR
jgi:uncharacterized protein (UPF0264 family)